MRGNTVGSSSEIAKNHREAEDYAAHSVELSETESLDNQPQTKTPSFWQRAKTVVLKQFLPISFAVALLVALTWPEAGKTLQSWKSAGYRIVPTVMVCIIFTISGITLKGDDIASALKAYVGLIYGLISILFITASVGFLMVAIPFTPHEFQTGFAIFCCVPTTLTSGITLTASAHGNAALALMLTVCSNLLGVATTPFILRMVLASASDVDLDPITLLLKLLMTVLLPLVVGKVVRGLHASIRDWVKACKVQLGIASNTALALIVWMNLSTSRDTLVSQRFTDILLVLVGAFGLHVAFLLINLPFTLFMPGRVVGWREKIAVQIMASQKTLPVSVSVIGFLHEAQVGDIGLITLPPILSHITQLFVDAFLATQIASWATKQEAKEHSDLPSFAAGKPLKSHDSNAQFEPYGDDHEQPPRQRV